MVGSSAHRPFDLSLLCGLRIKGRARVWYEYAGRLEKDDGALEIVAGDRTVLLDAAPDGEALRVREGAWLDPFAPPLLDENRTYVEKHGKWTRVDCSGEQPYATICDQPVKEVRRLLNHIGKEVGARISTPTGELWFVVAGDECRVYWAAPDDLSEG